MSPTNTKTLIFFPYKAASVEAVGTRYIVTKSYQLPVVNVFKQPTLKTRFKEFRKSLSNWLLTITGHKFKDVERVISECSSQLQPVLRVKG